MYVLFLLYALENSSAYISFQLSFSEKIMLGMSYLFVIKIKFVRQFYLSLLLLLGYYSAKVWLKGEFYYRKTTLTDRVLEND